MHRFGWTLAFLVAPCVLGVWLGDTIADVITRPEISVLSGRVVPAPTPPPPPAFNNHPTLGGGLRAYYTLNDTTGTDSLGLTTLEATEVLTQVAGKIAGAVRTANGGRLQANAPIATPTPDGVTMAGWFRADSVVGGGALTYAPISWRLNLVGGGSVNADVFDDIVGATTPAIAFSAATWHFLVVRFNPTTKTLSLTVDNGAAQSTTAPGSLPVAQGTVRLLESGAQLLQGDEIGFWGRILTAQETTDLYNAGAGLTY